MQKQAVSKKVKKFAWTDDKVEDLLKYINDYKTNCDFKGIDFEADLASLYAAVRKCIEDDVFQELNMLKSIHTTEKQRPKMKAKLKSSNGKRSRVQMLRQPIIQIQRVMNE